MLLCAFAHAPKSRTSLVPDSMAVRRVKDGVDVTHGADVVEPLAQVVALRPQQRHAHGVRPVAAKVDLPFEDVSTQRRATRRPMGSLDVPAPC